MTDTNTNLTTNSSDDDAGYSHSEPIPTSTPAENSWPPAEVAPVESTVVPTEEIPLPTPEVPETVETVVTETPTEAPVETPTDTAPAVAPDAAAAAAASSERGPRTDLEVDLFHVCNALATGSIVLAADVKPSPHVLAKEVHKFRNARAEAAGGKNELNPPSSGAVNAALVRWHEIGFIVLDTKPTSFKDFTPAGRERGLNALKAEFKATKAAAKAAIASTATPAPTPPIQPDTPEVVEAVVATPAPEVEVTAPLADAGI